MRVRARLGLRGSLGSWGGGGMKDGPSTTIELFFFFCFRFVNPFTERSRDICSRVFDSSTCKRHRVMMITVRRVGVVRQTGSRTDIVPAFGSVALGSRAWQARS